MEFGEPLGSQFRGNLPRCTMSRGPLNGTHVEGIKHCKSNFEVVFPQNSSLLCIVWLVIYWWEQQTLCGSQFINSLMTCIRCLDVLRQETAPWGAYPFLFFKNDVWCHWNFTSMHFLVQPVVEFESCPTKILGEKTVAGGNCPGMKTTCTYGHLHVNTRSIPNIFLLVVG